MKKLISFLFMLILFASTSYAQDDDLSWVRWENNIGKARWLNWHLGKVNSDKLKSKWNEVGIDIEKSSNEFAGAYFKYGWMSGYFLRWSPEKGFVYVNYFDVEHPCYFNYGKVSVDGYEVRFSSEFESDNLCPSSISKAMPKTWIPAIGGKYLIPKTEARSFGYYYGGFGAFNDLHRQLKDYEPFAHRWMKNYEPQEDFILPTNFENFVKEPINGKIIFVGKSRLKQLKKYEPPLFPMMYSSNYYTSTKVKINVGKKHNVTKGLEFILMKSGGFDSQTLKVTKVKKKTSEGVVLRFVDKNMKEVYSKYDYKKNETVAKNFKPIQIGEKITTSLMILEDSIKK